METILHMMVIHYINDFQKEFLQVCEKSILTFGQSLKWETWALLFYFALIKHYLVDLW